MREFDLDTIEEAVKLQLKASSIPSQLDQAQVEALPEGPGVYIFENEDGTPLYVGKSVTVKKRVLSHFASDYGSSSELKLAGQVKRLRAVPTHGELSALLLESEMVKELQPMYNRMLRQQKRMTLVLAEETADGYATVTVTDASEIAPEDGVRLLAVYSTAARARQSLHAVAMRYRLCPKLLGLEHTSRACFQSQLGKCDRACEGEEPAWRYNERFAEAFARQRVDAWPYAGAVIITERHPGMEGSAGYLVDNWCLLARLREFEDGTVENIPEAHRFDLDRYKIIRQFLANPAHRRAVTLVPAGADLSYVS